MPVYVYEVVLPDGAGGARFEVTQRMSEPALKVHPETGQAVRRVIQPVAIGGSWTESTMNRRMKDDKKLGELGFTKYVKAGDGVYEKRAGKGPRTITKDSRVSGGDFKQLD